MSFIGEAAVSKLLEVLMGKLIDSALNIVTDHKQVNQQLEQWISILPGIQAVLNDAEEKQIKVEGVKIWLDDLQDLAYDVDDILDKFAYEALRLKLQNYHAQASTSNVRKLILTCCIGGSFTPTSFLFNKSMISEMEKITARLNGLSTRRTSLGLDKILSKASSSKGKTPRLQPTAVMDENVEYVGRDNEQREMLDLLKTNNSNGVYVLSIVGMGGMGKTTLAQRVYKDAESFDHKAWVCVSEDFDAAMITNQILKFIDHNWSDQNDLPLLQVKLKEKLSGKTLLLVLDDIWNENYNDWTVLRSPFGAGTKIIVTTLLQNVSSNVDPVKAFHLDKLSHDDCSPIFTQHAFRAINFDGYPHLKEVGEKIVRRCDGLPLAAKAIGSLLCRVEDQGEWERIYESEIWDLPEDQCGIVPALRLSYHHLPSHLKPCFAYCSILPKDYVFEEEEIILLWRAEGFLQQKAKCQIKDLGKQYFQDLVSRSFFQISGKDHSRFVMHDLINDLAQVVAGELCTKLQRGKKQMFSNRTRHSSYLTSKYDTMTKFEAFDQLKLLRTFLPFKMLPSFKSCFVTNYVVDYLLPRLCYLRVLSLSGYEILELPDHVFENLKHLRYLNFSRTGIQRLPESLCTLYHLETLILKRCWRLQELPLKMENLVNLYYLDIRDANLIKKIPFGIDKLMNLERLSDFVIGEGDGHRFGELKHLSYLSGDFRLKGLENVNAQYAVEARLSEKSGIDRLELGWSGDFEKATRKKEVEGGVLESLCPSRKLKRLVIENYGGAKFSTWIADPSFKNMLSLELRNCKNCESLPSIGRLPLLKDLLVSGLDEVQKIGVELFGENESNAFASLETLCFDSLPNWKEWDPCEGGEQSSKLPRLLQLSIKSCPQLLGRLPSRLQSLQKLEIYDCKRLVVSISSFPSLRVLIIEGCEELVDECCSSSSAAVAEEVTCLQCVSLSDISKFSFPAERIMSRFAKSEHFSIGKLNKLEHMSEFNGLSLVRHRFIGIKEFPKLVSLETEEKEISNLSVIESLVVRDCERLKRILKVLYAFTSLTEMTLYDCPGLVCFAECNFPPALKILVIDKCENLEYLGDEKEDNKKSTMRSSSNNNTFLLEQLVIRKCESLICLSLRADICNGLLFLHMWSCSKLRSLFSNSKLPIKLKRLQILECPMLECIAQDFHETPHLDFIKISGAKRLESLPRGLDKLSHLHEIHLNRCSNLGSFKESGLLDLRTTNPLKVFSVIYCLKFRALPKCINNFTSLWKLWVSNFSSEISFTEEGFPTNLTFLHISKAPKLYTSLVQWGLHRLTSLQTLIIGGEGCSNVVSFPEQGTTLPPSLDSIDIERFENLEFMCSQGFQHLTSLRSLQISYCPKLKSLPEKDMLLSLGYLNIVGCPLLAEEGCSNGRGKGPEWSKIAHIPHVYIDNKRVIPRG